MSASTESLPKIKLSIKLPSQRSTPATSGAQTPVPGGMTVHAEDGSASAPNDATITETGDATDKPKVKIRLKLGQLKEDGDSGKGATGGGGSSKKRKSSSGGRKSSAAEDSDRPAKLSRPVKKKNMYTVMQQCIVDFVKRDSYGFFLSPVDTNLVSDYLSVIKRPMDFETMRRKIDDRVYKSFEEFKEDFFLICKNAMTYNAPETIFYKSAEKLEAYGRKHLEKQQKVVAADADFKEDDGQTDETIAASKIDLSKVSQIVQQHQRDLQTIQLLELQYQQREQQLVAATISQQPAESQNSSPKKPRRTYNKRQSTGLVKTYLPDGSVEPGDDYHDYLLPTLLFPFNYACEQKRDAEQYEGAAGKHALVRGYLDYGPYKTTQLNPAFGRPGPTVRPTTLNEHEFALMVCGDTVGAAYVDSIRNFARTASCPAVQAKINQRINHLTMGGAFAVGKVSEILELASEADHIDVETVPEEFQRFNYESEVKRVQEFERLFGAELGPWLQPRYDRIDPAVLINPSLPTVFRQINSQEDLKKALADVQKWIGLGEKANIEAIRQTLAGILRWVPGNQIVKPAPHQVQPLTSQHQSHYMMPPPRQQVSPHHSPVMAQQQQQQYMQQYMQKYNQ